MITRYGIDNFLFFLLIANLFVLVGIFVRPYVLGASLTIVGVALLAFGLLFFRDPPRRVPKEAQENHAVVLAPADGKVLLIEKLQDYPGIGAAIQISIFLAVYNVHVNRIPVTGTVTSIQYIPGKFFPAFKNAASRQNEQSVITVENAFGTVVFKQIVGILARRVVYDLQVGQKVRAGERFGMMKFGSRMDVIIPQNSSVIVKPGQKVRAGETILAYLPTQSGEEKAVSE